MSKDPTKRFSDRVENYVKYRPKYPQELFTFLLEEKILHKAVTAADIGSGTGNFARFLVELGCQTFAVEPNKEMREAAEEILKNYPNFISVNGTAEATTLASNSIDFISVAQAFHWFNRERTKEEFLRILKKEGYLALIWNNRLKAERPFMKEYNELLDRYYPQRGASNHYRITLEEISEFFGHHNVGIFRCRYQQMFDFPGLKGRLLSSSYASKKGDPNYLEVMNELEILFNKHQKNNQVQFDYETKMYYGQMVAIIED